jgi:branched-chain amino acid transport system ATP-binding protein
MEPTREAQPPLLQVGNIEVVYDRVILVLKGLALDVVEGSVVALLGPNGAGKTTTMKAISNLLRSERGEVTKGAIHYRGERIDGLEPEELVRRGVVQVMEGRHCFSHLTVEENLLTGAHTRKASTSAVRDSMDRVYHYFPRLKLRRKTQAGYLSGGEQQMCAIGRALMADLRMLLLDEPSMGLAPQLVEEIFQIVRRLNREAGVSILVAEQNTSVALRYADSAYILENGRIALSGSAAELRQNREVQEFYLGIGGAGRTSFRDTKSYRRRKKWLI